MFFIKTKLKQSDLHGIGLFADQEIAKGEPVYQHSPELDLHLTPEQFAALPPEEQATIKHYGYIEKTTGMYRLDHDDIRFINDSSEPNIGVNQAGILIAVRDIMPGEELTQSYYEFEDQQRKESHE